MLGVLAVVLLRWVLGVLAVVLPAGPVAAAADPARRPMSPPWPGGLPSPWELGSSLARGNKNRTCARCRRKKFFYPEGVSKAEKRAVSARRQKSC
ncbi:MAG: hypothetical protein IKK75_08155 [Clostridia bacterium]|nr:hypothetical protein [Clostridia bacterium]